MVYLIHFDRPYGHARHYIGFTTNLQARFRHHERGTGAVLLRAVRDAGINFSIVRTWPDGDRTFERRLKNCKNSARYCPICKGEHSDRSSA